jgi:hypothetical protein
MALRKQISTNVLGQNISFNNAYIKVVKVNGDKTTITASVDTLTEVNGQQISRVDYIFSHDLNNGNVIAQAYQHLKTLPEFAGAVDC